MAESTRKHLILVVDDDPNSREIVQTFLESRGYRVRTAPNGEAALAAVQAEVPELILLDVMMPGMDGPSTLKALRGIDATSSTPVVFMTAKVQAAEVAHYKSLGALGVIAKPFDPMTLAEQLRALWSEMPAAA